MLIAHLNNIRALFVLSRGAHAVVLVYDVTKETSLTALEVSLPKLSPSVSNCLSRNLVFWKNRSLCNFTLVKMR